jgi:hypothetical protein
MGWGGGVQDWRLWQTRGPRLQPLMNFAPNFSYCGTRDFGTSAASIRIGWESPHESQVRQFARPSVSGSPTNPPNQIYHPKVTQVLSWYLNHPPV